MYLNNTIRWSIQWLLVVLALPAILVLTAVSHYFAYDKFIYDISKRWLFFGDFHSILSLYFPYYLLSIFIHYKYDKNIKFSYLWYESSRMYISLLYVLWYQVVKGKDIVFFSLVPFSIFITGWISELIIRIKCYLQQPR